jgi:aminoglycoside phosphotransferase (APT) family kinase protein
MIVHSDFWSPNFKIEEEGNDESETRRKVAILDWASFYQGNGLGDLATLLIQGTRKDQFDLYSNLDQEIF